MAALPEVLSAELARHGFSTPEIATLAAILCAADAYRLNAEGQLIPGKPQAIAQCRHFLPPAMIKAISATGAESATGPAAKTLAYVQGLGAASWDSALGLGDSRIDPEVLAEVRKDISSMDATWERNAAILGVPSDTLKDAL